MLYFNWTALSRAAVGLGLVLGLFSLASCGEVPPLRWDAAPTDTPLADPTINASDASFKAPPDAAVDASPDALLDASPDTPLDAFLVIPRDAALDAALDAGPKAALDTFPEGPPKAPGPLDAPEEAKPERTEVAAGDVPDAHELPDAASEAKSEWTPKALEGLALWLDADLGVEKDAKGRVKKWMDQSGNNNHFTQEIETLRPEVSAVEGARLPAIVFGRGEQTTFLTAPDAESLRWGLGDFAVFVVCSFTNPPERVGVMLQKAWQAALGLRLHVWAGYLTGQLRYPDLAVVAAGPTLAGSSILVGVRRHSGSQYEARRNGRPVHQQTIQALNISAQGHDFYIGSDGDNPVPNQFFGTIAEIVVVKGPLSVEGLAAVESYLKGKHGLPMK